MSKVYSKIDSSGNISWYREGTNFLHREDGPAIEWANGDKEWYRNGYLYRIDGPAVEYANNFTDNEYYLNGRWYPDIKTNEEFIIFQIIN